MPLFWLSIAFVAGLVLGGVVPWGASAWIGLAGALLVLALVEHWAIARSGRFQPRWYPDWQRIGRVPLAVVLAAVALGALRSVSAHPPLTESDLAWYNQKGTYRLVGVIQQPPARSEKTINLIVAIDRLTALEDGQPAADELIVHGQAWVSLRSAESWRYGDRVEFTGAPLEPGAGDGDYFREYLGRKDIYTALEFPAAHLLQHDAGSPFWAWLFDLRALCERTLRALLPQPEAGLLIGILLGSANSLPEAVSQAFRQTGIAHIIAVSGFNIAIVAGLFIQILGRMLRARFAVPLALLGIVAYSLLTGATPSVVRAAIMGSMGLFGPLLGRRQVGVNSLALTAGIMCLLDPELPADVSFQLSFAATLGLVLYAEPLQQAFTRLASRWLSAPLAQRLAGPVGEYFLFTLAAQIFTLPVTALHFQQVSLSALLTNPLVLPVQPLAMILGGAALLLGLAFAPLGQLVGLLCWPLLAYTIRAAELLAQLPHSTLNLGRLSPAVVLIYYGILLILAIPPLRRFLLPVWKPAVAVGLAGLLAVGVWRLAFVAPDGRLHLDALNLPGGPALLLRSPDGQTWLVNGSSQADALADALGRRISPLDDHLDGLILTERAAAPLAGLENLLQTYPPRLAGLSARLPDSGAHKRLTAELQDAGTQVIRLEPGQAFNLGQGVEMRTWVDSPAGTALWLEWQGFRVFIPGGVAPTALPRPLPAGISLLVLGPADLEQSTLEGWADVFQPQSVLLTAGPPTGLPGEIALEAYQWVSFTTTGSQLWVEGIKK